MSADNGSKIAWLIPAAAAAGAIGGSIGSLLCYRWSRRTLGTQTLHTPRRESPRCKYEPLVEDDNKRLETASDSEKSDILRHSIENQRRTVSQYSFIMLRALDGGILRRRDVFGYWSSGALYIIPQAIQRIGHVDDTGLERLCQQALDFEKREERQRNSPTVPLLAHLLMFLVLLLTVGVLVFLLP